MFTWGPDVYYLTTFVGFINKTTEDQLRTFVIGGCLVMLRNMGSRKAMKQSCVNESKLWYFDLFRKVLFLRFVKT